ncbi:hypothetical protein JQ617_16840 [Bradyrhizobium sp. KB893862 SZCCT0404]|uniref:hypothetical protein n=1 Tax=Bradyrhizobium sp. KB893862 SZCCT0404 TaxID=2807672 RepID=UPI001BA64FF4|nr:hypothetical protein [Bradyrhizobium sp. KB893862 SZCCT0404]MBR1175626.1 hypothetical protein [Bradyrhizobium sp. KB893862 SZCCT0404]
MMVRSGNPAVRLGTLMSVAALILLGAGGAGWPQSSPPSLGLREQGQQAAPPPSTPASSAQPEREENPGLINEMGKLFDKLPSILPPIKSPGETMNDLSRLAKPSTMVSGRVACPASSNGAPDCKQAADQLCQSKGYKEGKGVNADSAEKCSAKVLIPGRQRKPDDCRTDTFVTSALCQN